ncbi:NAD(P)H-hydrate dehydratase [Sulfurimonas sp. HSL-3221]|uniref:NAD(P)H-hydrate dehydratase n=1 Tax=Sulfurimonadaceae TaxID=2771471 RepID=UPI001E3F0901|nr:NAD(P)H-hydrate dehydratase [Sulfurimonas sp. HSL-3221]UFS62660.1 NAD(P)H-hydrate dehydratase [Sulfurimonas sp. HSL-3221]
MQNLFDEVDSLDRRCYDAYGLSEELLMEHAAEAMAGAVRERFGAGSRVVIVCGPGNNGADGLALARLLHGVYHVEVVLPLEVKSPMARLQYERLQKLGVPVVDAITPCDVLVDAIFGSGLGRPLGSGIIGLIKLMNALGAFKLACDIPTGLRSGGSCDTVVFRADLTVTMGALKRGMFSDAAKNAVGEITVAELGVSRSLYEKETPWKLLERDDLHLPLRENADVHKGSFGHLGIVCGEKSGAAIIAGKAALRFGVGLVTLLSNEEVAIPYELMQSHLRPKTVNAVAIGMGLGQEFAEQELRERIDNDIPLVCDADIFAHPMLGELLKRKRIVLTPHPKEFTTLLSRTGIATTDVRGLQQDRFKFVEAFCRAYPDAVLLLKGANVIIGQGDQFYVNPHGTNALAKGGSGDVLSGLVGALLAQGYTPLDAAIHASLAHTEAARRFKGQQYALTPDDLIEGVCCL